MTDSTRADASTAGRSDGDDRCSLCGGERTVTVDMFTDSRGHFTIEEPCECTEDEHEEIEPEDLAPLEKWWPSVDGRT